MDELQNKLANGYCGADSGLAGTQQQQQQALDDGKKAAAAAAAESGTTHGGALCEGTSRAIGTYTNNAGLSLPRGTTSYVNLRKYPTKLKR